MTSLHLIRTTWVTWHKEITMTRFTCLHYFHNQHYSLVIICSTISKHWLSEGGLWFLKAYYRMISHKTLNFRIRKLAVEGPTCETWLRPNRTQRHTPTIPCSNIGYRWNLQHIDSFGCFHWIRIPAYSKELLEISTSQWETCLNILNARFRNTIKHHISLQLILEVYLIFYIFFWEYFILYIAYSYVLYNLEMNNDTKMNYFYAGNYDQFTKKPAALGNFLFPTYSKFMYDFTNVSDFFLSLNPGQTACILKESLFHQLVIQKFWR